MIPYSITVGNAAAPEASLSFLFWLVRIACHRDLHHCRLLVLPRQDAEGGRLSTSFEKKD